MAKKLEPDIVLILMNQHAIMTALQSIMCSNVIHAHIVPLLSYQLKETDKSIKNDAVADKVQ